MTQKTFDFFREKIEVADEDFLILLRDLLSAELKSEGYTRIRWGKETEETIDAYMGTIDSHYFFKILLCEIQATFRLQGYPYQQSGNYIIYDLGTPLYIHTNPFFKFL